MTQIPNDPLALIKERREAIEARRAKVRDLRAELDAEVSALAKEETELAVAERVIGRLASKSPQSAQRAKPSATPPAKANGAGRVAGRGKSPPRPKGIPSTPDMVTTLLLEAEAQGIYGLTGREIMQAVEARWWPGVSESAVIPTIYRCIKKGHWFKKEGAHFKRRKDGVPERTPSKIRERVRLDA